MLDATAVSGGQSPGSEEEGAGGQSPEDDPQRVEADLPLLRFQRSGPELHQTPRCKLPEMLFRTVWRGREGQESEAREKVGRARSWITGSGAEGLRPFSRSRVKGGSGLFSNKDA